VVTSTRVLYIGTGRRLGLFHAAVSMSARKQPPAYMITMVKGEIFTYSGKRNPVVHLLSQAVIK